MTSGQGVYVYAVVPGDTGPVQVRGVGDTAVDLLRHQDLAMALSDVRTADLAVATDGDADPRVLADLARRHHSVVQAVADRAEGALPFRLGTVLTGRDAAQGYLRSQADTLRAALRRVAGCAEWSVTVRAEPADRPGPDGSVRSGAATGPGTAATGPGTAATGPGTAATGPARAAQPAGPDTARASGTAYLLGRRDQLREAENSRRAAARLAAGVDARLSALATDATDGRAAAGLLDRIYLVPNTAAERFVAEVDACGDHLADNGYALRLSGPWPAYSFVAADLGAADHA